jgi:rod shape-determining protein MreC
MSGERNLITLDRGMNDGVRVGMAVMTDAGLVGRVFSTSGGFSLVENLYNTTLKVAAKVERSRIDGIIGWEEGPELLMRNVPKAHDVEIGDRIVTSEYSIYFPSDVPIGTVVKLEDEPNSLFRRIVIMPEAIPERVEHCFIVLTTTPGLIEKLKLEESSTKPADRKPK